MKFVIDHDLHIHSRLSTCSRHQGQTPETILNYARAQGLRHICLTDHFWDETVPGASNWYAPQNYPHVAQSLPLPSADGIRFDFGCETDMDHFLTVGISRERLKTFDFVIIPTSHLHMSGFTIDPSIRSVDDRAHYYMERNLALLDMDLPFHKIGLAHFTCPLLDRGCDGSFADILDAVSDNEYAAFFARAAACGLGIELNTSLESASRPSSLRPYRIAKECGCKFYLGSDAHSPDDLAGARVRFEAIIDALELTEEDKLPFARS